jgi:membrane fusion protein (multidrug efflux system)
MDQGGGGRPQPPEPAPARKRNRWRLPLMIVVPLILVAIGAYLWLTGGRYVETDNAYVQQHMVALSADVEGRIVAVPVRLNQSVKAGDVIFKIDPTPFQIALDQANAALASARLNVEQLKVAYGTAEAKLSAAEAALDIQQRELDRQTSLAGKGFQSQSNLDQLKLDVQAAQSNVELARQGVQSAVAALVGNPDIAVDDHPLVKTAQAQVESAQRDLAQTTVKAPADGVVSQVDNLNVGQFVQKGTQIAALVETDEAWVEANYKETQLTGIEVGQPATVTVDAYPGLEIKGHVASIGAATGAEFSVLPAQNATGNWVKVTQRLPVEIAIDSPERDRLRAGMSVTVTVDTQPENGLVKTASGNPAAR